MRGRATIVGAVLGLLAAAAIAHAASYGGAASPHAPASVGAYGNGIYDTQDLAFRPAATDATVGELVRWTNRDLLVPHTVTEDHGLFDLAGSYGMTPVNPAGFAPGSTVERIFDAGTYHYYCRVHPKQMHGTVSVPVELTVASRTVVRRVRVHGRLRRMRVRTYSIVATWAHAAPAAGQVFDVERRRGTGAWSPWLAGAGSTSAAFAAVRGTTWSVRARLRRASDTAAASDWSPVASATAG